jgi:small subunit ribosomal protein S7
MKKGKKSVSANIVYDALGVIHEKLPETDPLEVVLRAIDNVKPKVEVKSRRVGGATYQVPVEVSGDRQMALAMRWLVQYAKTRKGVPMRRALALEILDAYGEQGNAIKKRDDTHKMAQANKAFAHYRW